MLFTLIYTPCLSAIAASRSESKNTGFIPFFGGLAADPGLAGQFRVLPGGQGVGY